MDYQTLRKTYMFNSLKIFTYLGWTPVNWTWTYRFYALDIQRLYEWILICITCFIWNIGIYSICICASTHSTLDHLRAGVRCYEAKWPTLKKDDDDSYRWNDITGLQVYMYKGSINVVI